MSKNTKKTRSKTANTRPTLEAGLAQGADTCDQQARLQHPPSPARTEELADEEELERLDKSQKSLGSTAATAGLAALTINTNPIVLDDPRLAPFP